MQAVEKELNLDEAVEMENVEMMFYHEDNYHSDSAKRSNHST